MTIYAVMLIWSLPKITDAAGGLVPFDMRPGGYSFEKAKAFLSALPPDIVAFYRDIQIGLLDTAYPGLLALSLFLAIALLAPKKLGYGRWTLALIAVPSAVFDYMENTAIRTMLALGPDGITSEIVADASSNSQSKAAATTFAMVVLLGLLAIWLWGWWQARRQSA